MHRSLEKYICNVDLLFHMCPDISDKLNFELAAKQAIVDSNTDFIIDKLGIEILKEYKSRFIDQLKNKIINSESEGNEYEPLPLERIDVPKKYFTLRPGALPEIIDRIYYQALCNALAPTIENNLMGIDDKVVFSYRLSNKNDDGYMFIEPSVAYNDFISYQNSLCENNDFSYVLETDIADYFERIYHHNLKNLLDGFNCDPEIVIALAKLLRKWTEGVSYGIPQGIWPSDLLGNAYLHYLDVAMISDEYKYIRYVDDIRVFCKNEIIAKKALMKITQTIRPMGLNLQPAKTYIIKKDSFCTKIRPFYEKLGELKERHEKIIVNFDPYFNEFEFTEVPEEPLEIRGLDDLFESATIYPINEQELKFCLNAYTYTRQPNAVSFCLDHLSDLPHLSSYFINYLTSLGYDQEISQKILIFIESEENIYQWQEMWLLRYFYLLPELTMDLRISLRRIFLDGNRHVACRSIAASILGKLGDLSDLNLLKDKFKYIESLWIRKAIIVAINRLPHADRNQVYNYWKKQHWCLSITVEYAKKNRRIADST